MKIRIVVFAIHLGFTFFCRQLQAQLVNDGGSVTINIATNLAGALTVGNNSGNTILTIGTGGAVTDSNGQIGLNAGSDDNSVTVQSTTGSWINSGNVSVGVSGSDNLLRLRTGGFISADATRIGENNSGSNNTAVLSGSNSLWTNSANMNVGFNGSGNILIMTNGPTLIDDTGIIGTQGGSSNNFVFLSDSGTLWSNRTDLRVGGSGTFNTLIVSNDATATAGGDFILGRNAGSVGNIATLSGGNILVAGSTDVRRGTLVLNSGTLQAVGFLATNGSESVIDFNGGTLIASGGTIANGQSFVVGKNLGSEPAVFDLRAEQNFTVGGSLVVGSVGSGARLVITNGGDLVVSSNSVLGDNEFSGSHLALVSGPGSSWTSTGDLHVGEAGSLNRLVISNGAWVADDFGVIGSLDTSDNNEIMVTGANSVWTNQTSVMVGSAGSNNRLIITNGGKVTGYIGTLAGTGSSFNNQAVVTGGGSLWFNESSVVIGGSGSGNSLSITNGGRVEGDNGFLGNLSSSSNNVAVVTGLNSLWTNRPSLYVGYDGRSNRLVVADGAVVAASSDIFVGYHSTSVNNLVSVSNGTLTAGATLDVRRGTLQLDAGSVSCSKLLLTNSTGKFNFNGGTVYTKGGTVSNGSTFIVGANGGGDTARFVLDGGQDFKVNGNFTVGLNDPGAQLTVTNGGRLVVMSASSRLGENSGSTGNSALVSGPGSLWTNQGDLYVGDAGSGNRLVITNGGRVENVQSFIGSDVTSDGNEVIVTGANSIWTNQANLTVGYAGDGSRLIITNGGQVGAVSSIVGNSSSSNVVIVTGTNSLWDIQDSLTFGLSGVGNSLVIANGGTVRSQSGFITYFDTSSNNTVVINGVGSAWFVNNLYVGRTQGNRLTVANGGRLQSQSGNISSYPSSSDNEVLVTGANSVWTNSSSLYVGALGPGGRLVITNGGRVWSYVIVLGSVPDSTANLLRVNNGSLTATDTLDIRQGTLQFSGGDITANALLITTNLGTNIFNSGTMTIGRATINNTRTFVVGDGINAAVYVLTNSGLHTFTSGLLISNNATLSGNGTISGIVTVRSGGRISPGASIGTLVFSNSPVLQGATVMEISRNGATLANDQIQVVAPIAYSGSLTVSNLGPTALTAGNNFKLFTATAYSGSFSGLTLPSLPAGLSWTNKLLVDGSIAVISGGSPAIGSVSVSGTNLVFNVSGTPGDPFTILTTTNINTPMTAWLTNLTGNFDGLGSASVTNGINKTNVARFFRVRIP